jgi:1,4-alpha-glucan branching enzyme
MTTARSLTSSLTRQDIDLFREGTHTRLYEHLGCRMHDEGGHFSAHFSVWAPNARAVHLIGDFNGWNAGSHAMNPRWDSSGLWEIFVPDVPRGSVYKYRVTPRSGGAFDKADPFAFSAELPPCTGSRAWTLEYDWNDDAWMADRARRSALNAPVSIYEAHLGSWRRHGGNDGQFLSYREAGAQLAQYASEMGFTHIELLPICEHPFYGSWGYQTTGYFAPTARYGAPQDLKAMIDVLHQRGIGVILDWTPSHFPDDGHGLSRFDGTALYEHDDPRQGHHPDWDSSIFNYGRHEVRAFLLSSAHFWLREYHFDGLRVDAVASMLYLDYGRKPGEWIPNRHGGKENLEAIEFLRLLNTSAYREFPGVQLIAEESTAWPRVTRPVDAGGLGFGYKWNMGWMNDTLAYFREDPVFRRYRHDTITFSLMYAFAENFVLPLSHDEVVHGKGSLLNKQPGDTWRQFAGLRALFGYMWTHPGKKLLFMGGEFGQRREWTHDGELEWRLLRFGEHAGLQRWVADLNRLYRQEKPLHDNDVDGAGFDWIDTADKSSSTISYLRRARDGSVVLVVCNFTPVPRLGFRIGAPCGGFWTEIANSDAQVYGGSGMGNLGGVPAAAEPSHGREFSLTLTLPPLAIVIFKPRLP